MESGYRVSWETFVSLIGFKIVQFWGQFLSIHDKFLETELSVNWMDHPDPKKVSFSKIVCLAVGTSVMKALRQAIKKTMTT